MRARRPRSRLVAGETPALPAGCGRDARAPGWMRAGRPRSRLVAGETPALPAGCGRDARAPGWVARFAQIDLVVE